MKKPRKRLKAYLFFTCALVALWIVASCILWVVGQKTTVVKTPVASQKTQRQTGTQTPSQKVTPEVPEKPARFCFKLGQDEFRIYKLLEADPKNPFLSRNRAEEFEAELTRKLADGCCSIHFEHTQTPTGVEQVVALEKSKGQQCERIELKRGYKRLYWYKSELGQTTPNEKGETQILYKQQFGETQQIAQYGKGQGIARFEAYKGEIPLKAELFSFLESCLTTELLLKLQAREQQFRETCSRLLDGVSGNPSQSQLATAVVLKTPKETELTFSHESKDGEAVPFKLLAILKIRVPREGMGFNELPPLSVIVQVESETVSLHYEYTMPEPHGNEFYEGLVPAQPRKATLLITKKTGEAVEQLLLSGEIVRGLETFNWASCEGILLEKAVESVKYRKYPKDTQEDAQPNFELVKGFPISNEFHRTLMTLFREFTLPLIEERLAKNKAAFNLFMGTALKTLEKESLLSFQDRK